MEKLTGKANLLRILHNHIGPVGRYVDGGMLIRNEDGVDVLRIDTEEDKPLDTFNEGRLQSFLQDLGHSLFVY